MYACKLGNGVYITTTILKCAISFLLNIILNKLLFFNKKVKTIQF